MDWKNTAIAASMAAFIWIGVDVSSAHACSIVSNVEHLLDADEQAIDSTDPSVPSMYELQIVRRPAPSGCSTQTTLCDGRGAIGLGIQAQDDRTSSNMMGYRIRLIDGVLPEGMNLSTEPVRPFLNDLLWLDFSDRDQSIGFTVAVHAVDLAGNEGPAVEVEVYDDVGGCSASGRDRAGWLLLVGAVLVLHWRRRRV